MNGFAARGNHVSDTVATMLVGAHVPGDRPLEEAALVGAQCLQMFLGPPQSWKKPPLRDDHEELRDAAMPIYVHAPYLINVASPNNRIRIPSRKILSNTIERAEEIGAAGVIVHGGHAEDGIDRGFMRWRKVFEEIETDVPILVENTAGGTNAMARRVETLVRLWEQLQDFDVGFCFDTCHAHSAGEELVDVVDRVLAAVGRIDLVHCNDSKDPAGSGRDRHSNFADGQIEVDALVEMVKRSRAPAVICETPWSGISEDLIALKQAL